MAHSWAGLEIVSVLNETHVYFFFVRLFVLLKPDEGFAEKEC